MKIPWRNSDSSSQDFPDLLIFDGAMGTMLQKAGLRLDIPPEMANVEMPAEVEAIHRAYMEAGSMVVSTNTFGGTDLKLQAHQMASRVEEFNIAGAQAARRAVGSKALVAGSMGPTGQLMAPFGTLTFKEAARAFRRQAAALQEGGVDLFIVETFSDPAEARAAVYGIREVSDLPIFVSMTYTPKGHTLTGSSPRAVAATLDSLPIQALGMNCGFGPSELVNIFTEFAQFTTKPLLLQANAGIPKLRDGKTVFDILPDDFAQGMARYRKLGMRVAGGCCGTTPDHIRALSQTLRGTSWESQQRNPETGIISGTKAVAMFGGALPFMTIGERINPTGKKKLTGELREGKMTLLKTLAASQALAGAKALDLNVGVPGADEPELMEKACNALSGVSDLPVVIDSRNFQAVTRALECLRGKPLVNSFTGDDEEIEKAIQIIRQYGASVMFLTLDETGIPATLEGRMKIVDRILKATDQAGIPRRELVFDALAMAVASDQSAPAVTLDTLSELKHRHGLATTLGVSNVSFGLPERKIVNSAFLTMAISRGLDMGIVNPSEGLMMAAAASADLLCGRDPGARNFVERAPAIADALGTLSSGKKLETQTARGAENENLSPLMNSVLTGDRELALEAAGAIAPEMMQKAVDEELIPAIKRVGDLYGEGKLFLPQLIGSAEALKEAMRVISPHIQQGGGIARKGRIIMATVKGDIHDIGKNIVCLVLENHGFQVTDLGKDVPLETIVEKARELKPDFVGLSALMTTTMEAMRETTEAIHKTLPGIPVVVGGACVDQKFAESIGAIYGGLDAMEAAEIITGAMAKSAEGEA